MTKWEQHASYKEAYHPHQFPDPTTKEKRKNPKKISKEELFSKVSEKYSKPDPATVEAELQLEEELWNQ
jgi:hypothetical protein